MDLWKAIDLGGLAARWCELMVSVPVISSAFSNSFSFPLSLLSCVAAGGSSSVVCRWWCPASPSSLCRSPLLSSLLWHTAYLRAESLPPTSFSVPSNLSSVLWLGCFWVALHASKFHTPIPEVFCILFIQLLHSFLHCSYCVH